MSTGPRALTTARESTRCACSRYRHNHKGYVQGPRELVSLFKPKCCDCTPQICQPVATNLSAEGNRVAIMEFTPQFYDEHWGGDWNDMKIYGPTARHTRRIVLNLLRGLSFYSVLRSEEHTSELQSHHDLVCRL